MENEKGNPPTGSPNWLFGLDKLTTPSLDYAGLKLRDKLRTYLNKKARDRAMLRRYETEFLYREIELLNYGTDQYAAYLETLGNMIVLQHFQTLLPIIRFAITNYKIPPEKAFECVISGFARKTTDLADGELILASTAAGMLDILLTIQVSKVMFQFANVPSSAHIQDSTLTDEQIEAIMQDKKTIAAISDAIGPSDWGAPMLFAKALTEIYGFEWDEGRFKAHEAAFEQNDLTELG